jgi:hypothetical protein
MFETIESFNIKLHLVGKFFGWSSTKCMFFYVGFFFVIRDTTGHTNNSFLFLFQTANLFEHDLGQTLFMLIRN